MGHASPHVRGPLRLGVCLHTDRGITPACAGTTFAVVFSVRMIGDHPRMCGDHIQLRKMEMVKTGSPPHVRGPHGKQIYAWVTDGITPACAGTTATFYTTTSKKGDHPRMCGDHCEDLYVKRTGEGSPPHVRGPRNRWGFARDVFGITPACAGTTTRNLSLDGSIGDHPRMCGDHKAFLKHDAIVEGSPPHERGPL